MSYKRFVPMVCLVVGVLFIAAQAEFYPNRIYKERKKTSLDFGWKFIQDDPGNPLTGIPYASSYNDGSWETVNIPHSASYDPPTKTDEDASFKGICWYRLKFQVPASARHTGKLFLEFEGAMQIADVWLNDQKLGTHDNSGYTGFSFDITSTVMLTGDNVLAVRLDNNYSTAIPPGNPGDAMGPDYYIFSGLYRDVWLVCTDKCYIPLYGQRISVPQGPYTSGAPVRIKTSIRNDNTSAKSVMLKYVIADASDGIVAFDTMTQTVNASTSVLFDKVVSPIQNPHLWSLTDPYLYRVFTQVFVDGVLTDDYAERFGVRWFTWASSDRFKLNGDSVYFRGNSLHQMFPWIQNSVPSSRFYKDLEQAKDMGVNLVRCAHYPRDPSYYNACDELGLLLFVEIPTWGSGKNETYYPAAFWAREDSCVREMIRVGYNHPSIIAWGLFNEAGGNFTTRIAGFNTTAHGQDSTRMTYMANNNRAYSIMGIPDIAGLNYLTSSQITVTPLPTRFMNTEYHVGWTGDYAYRGDPNDIPSVIAAHFWRDWMLCVNDPLLSGGTAWCHADYNSPMNYLPMGVVDCYRLPKSTFYLYRYNWRGVADDNPVTGLTPAGLRLEADTNKLIADSVDCAFFYASIRDANGTCVHTGYNTTSTTNVTFSVTGPANWFGPLTMKVNGGKCALLVKSTNTPGTICVTATTAGLPQAQTCIASEAPDTTPLPFIASVITGPFTPSNKNIAIKRQANTLRIIFPVKGVSVDDASIINMRGQKMSCPAVVNGTILTIDTKRLAAGSYYLSISRKPYNIKEIRRVLIAR